MIQKRPSPSPRWMRAALLSLAAVLLAASVPAQEPVGETDPPSDRQSLFDVFRPPLDDPAEQLEQHPLADVTLNSDEDGPTSGPLPLNLQAPFPFIRYESDASHRLLAFHPLFSVFKEMETGRHEVHVLWPFIRYSHRPGWWFEMDRRDVAVFPLWWSRWGERDGVETSSRIFIPLYFGGRQGDTRYEVLLPFLWFSNGANVPLFFPPRPQNFAAVWPIAGDFRGYWNRDGVQWLLWPLFVRSWKGEGAVRFHTHTFLWPFFSLYTGEKVDGFRVWPLVSWVRKDDDFTRAYWLWPLGHYRNDLPDERGRFTRGVLFFPFYGNLRTRDFVYKLFFPVYGSLDMKGRSVRGWALAAYNQDDNHRKGTRRHRLLWFLITWGSEIPIKEEFLKYQTEEEIRASATKGGGLFPLYVERYSNRMKRQLILWPLFYRKWNAYPDGSTFDRWAVAQVYYNGVEKFDDGSESVRQMFWPFYRKRVEADGRRRQNALHLIPMVDAESVDRNWTPLLAFWTKETNPATNEHQERLLGGVVEYNRDWRGVERRRFDTLVFSHEHTWGERRPSETHTRFLGGLVGRYRLGDEVKTELFWKKF